MKETIADVSSASPSSERMRGLWVNGVKKGIKEEAFHNSQSKNSYVS